MVIIENYVKHMTKMELNVIWMKLTQMLSIFIQTLGPPFVGLPLLQNSQ